MEKLGRNKNKKKKKYGAYPTCKISFFHINVVQKFFTRELSTNRVHDPQIQISCFDNFYNIYFFFLSFPGIKVFELLLYGLSWFNVNLLLILCDTEDDWKTPIEAAQDVAMTVYPLLKLNSRVIIKNPFKNFRKLKKKNG